MTLDRYRTTKTEKRKNNCYCSVARFKAGAPHQKNYCRKLEIRQYEDSMQVSDGVPF